MRQGQQNRRGRGRNNNRKNHNPLARSFESNGPDVKIRGTPAHIAEKYLTLARDAQSSGDPVLAENYLQHAEHYSRIIMAYREQMQQPGEMMNGHAPRMREPGEGGEELGEEEGDDLLDDGFTAQHQMPQQHQMPPRHSGGHDGNRHDRPFRRDQGGFRNRDRDRDHRDRGDRDRGDRDRVDRDRGGDRPPMEGRSQDRGFAPERHQEAGEGGGHEQRRDGAEQRRRDRFQQPHEQPDFLRRPVRRTRSESDEPASPVANKDEPSRD